jgi:outer membrane protein assembly factor BamA
MLSDRMEYVYRYRPMKRLTRKVNAVLPILLWQMPARSPGLWLVMLLLGASPLLTKGQDSSANGRKNAAGASIHRLEINLVDKDSSILGSLQLKTRFTSAPQCHEYLVQLDSLLAIKGYASASVDSVIQRDTLTIAYLFLGEQYRWGNVRVNGLTTEELNAAGLMTDRNSGAIQVSRSRLNTSWFSPRQMEKIQDQLLQYLFDNGYPFASVQTDSLQVTKDDKQQLLMNAVLMVNKGMVYKIDSIQVKGKASINASFLHRYLDIPQGMPFRKSSFNSISARLRELQFLEESQPWALRFGGNGAILDLYLEPKKSSQINVLLGLLPTTNSVGQNKFQVTGEANLNLKNALGNGETIGVNWQQLQVKSPRLNLLYQQPYLFGSAFGISTQFDLFKKDSSFLTVNGQLGVQYALSARQTGKVFVQLFRSNLVDVDTARIKSTKRLPNDMDMGIINLGVDYELFTTNYRRNPRRGWELFSTVMAGTRTIRKSNAILDIKDPNFDYASLYDTVDLKSYQFRFKVRVARFFPIGRQATIQVLMNGGWVQSPTLYRNEVFQIGGYKLMRGFDEESIYSSRYLVNTLEYRYLVGMNSYFFGFADLGFTANKSSGINSRNRLLGAGLGMAFETTAGFFNLSLAAGKRDDSPFNLRQTKIHLGYVNYF